MPATQAQILSFDDVKRFSRTSRLADRSVRATSQPVYVDSSDAYSPRRRNRTFASAAASTVRITRAINPSRAAAEVLASSGQDAAQVARSASPRRPSRSASTVRSASALRSAQAVVARSFSNFMNGGSALNDEPVLPSRTSRAAVTTVDPQQNARKTRAAKMEEKKRERTKRRADRKFEKEFGALDEARNQAAGADAPRAAVYKTQMGSSQKKANRLQQSASAAATGAKAKLGGLAAFNPALLLETVGRSRKAIIGLAVAACLLITCVFLYPTAQTYYQAVRENDRLQAEYSALQERNQQLEDNVNSLQNTDGIEQRAHDQLGWVKKGETSVTVNGLGEVSEQSSSNSSSLVASVDSSEIEMPQTWYSPVLDLVFGVK